MRDLLKIITLIWLMFASAYPSIVPFSEILGYLPFLFITILTDKLPLKIEYVGVFLLVYLFQIDHSVRVVNIFTTYVVPLIVLDSILQFQQNGYQLNYFKYAGLLLYMTNCILVIIEYTFKINTLSWDMSYFTRFRATGLWIHPLFNALIHGMTMLYIICSSLPKTHKFILFVLGIPVIFMFDARAATIMVLLLSLYIGYVDKGISLKRFIQLSIIIVCLYPILSLIFTTELGGKLLNPESFRIDVSTEPRLVPFYILSDLSFSDIFWGVGSEQIGKLCTRYRVVAIENSFILSVLRDGLVSAGIFYVCLISRLYKVFSTINRRIRIAFIVGFIVVGGISTALTNVFVWYCVVVLYICFQPYIIARLSPKYCNIQHHSI